MREPRVSIVVPDLSSLFQARRVGVLSGALGGIPVGLEKIKTGQVKGYKLVAHPQETA